MPERDDIDRATNEEHGLLNVHSGADEAPRHDVGGSLNEFITEAHERDDTHHAGTLGEHEVADDTAIPVEVGQDVMCLDGEKLGEVVDVRDDVIVVERGFLVPEDVFVPRDHVRTADAHGIQLDCERDPSWRDDPEADPDEQDDPISP